MVYFFVNDVCKTAVVSTPLPSLYLHRNFRASPSTQHSFTLYLHFIPPENVEVYGNTRKITGIWTGSDSSYTLPATAPKAGDALVVKFKYPVRSLLVSFDSLLLLKKHLFGEHHDNKASSNFKSIPFCLPAKQKDMLWYTLPYCILGHTRGDHGCFSTS